MAEKQTNKTMREKIKEVLIKARLGLEQARAKGESYSKRLNKQMGEVWGIKD